MWTEIRLDVGEVGKASVSKTDMLLVAVPRHTLLELDGPRHLSLVRLILACLFATARVKRA